MLRPPLNRSVSDPAQVIVNRDDQFVNDPTGGKSHMANARLHRDVRDESREEPDVRVADITDGGPNQFRTRADFNVSNDGCHDFLFNMIRVRC